jgi:tetratricopeptide (TPR) repeat protein
MPAHSYYRRFWLISIGLFAGCGTTSDPDTDRRTVEAFVNAPAKGDESVARAAAERLAGNLDRSGTPRDRLILAGFLEATGDSGKALNRLTEIPDDLEDSRIAAAARLSEGRIAFYRTRQARRAETALTKATKLDPGSSQTWLPLADLYDIQNRRNERDKCYARLDSASALDRERLVKWTCDRRLDSEAEELAHVLEAFLDADPADIDSGVALAEESIRKGEFQAANKILDRLDNSTDPSAATSIALRKALIAAEQGEFDEAKKMIDTVEDSKIAPRDDVLRNRLLGRIGIQSRDYRAAESALRKVLATAPHDREAHQLMVQALRFDGRTDEAATVSDRLKSIDKLEDLGQKVRASLRRDDPKTLREIADTAASLGRFELAKAWLRQLLTKDPLNSELQQEIYRLDQRASAAK